MAIPLLLLAILEQHGRGEDKRHVDTNDTECSREDGVKEGVGEAHKGGDATDIRGGCEGVRAGGVGDEEWWGGGVVVAAAVELYHVSIPSSPTLQFPRICCEREGRREDVPAVAEATAWCLAAHSRYPRGSGGS
jgi:hypothetical protein